jgi:hypothetical protein
MHIKENDQIPNADVFVMENGEPVKKNTQTLLKDKKVVILVFLEHILLYVQQNISQDM